MRSIPTEKPLHWVGSSKKDLVGLPAEVVDDFGYALGAVQVGAALHKQNPGKARVQAFLSW
jgi:phage-related protein